MKKESLQGKRPVFLLLRRRILTARFELWLLFIAVIACITFQPSLLRAIQPDIAPASATHGTVHAKDDEVASRTTHNSDGSAQAIASVPAVVPAGNSVQTTVASSCQQNGMYQTRPAGVDLGSYGEGLTMINDTPAYYQVTGATTTQLRSMMLVCGPKGDFAAVTGYTINWSYALRSDDTGLCRVVGVKVGIHTNMLLPTNQSTQTLGTWQSFMSGLTTHESGHVAIADQYGSKLLDALRNYPAGDCYTMGPAVDTVAQEIVSHLDMAQAQYDSATGHGTTQGASL